MAIPADTTTGSKNPHTEQDPSEELQISDALASMSINAQETDSMWVPPVGPLGGPTATLAPSQVVAGNAQNSVSIDYEVGGSGLSHGSPVSYPSEYPKSATHIAANKLNAHQQRLVDEHERLRAEVSRLLQVYKSRESAYRRLAKENTELGSEVSLERIMDQSSLSKLWNEDREKYEEANLKLSVSESTMGYLNRQGTELDKTSIGRAIASSMGPEAIGMNLGSAVLGGEPESAPRPPQSSVYDANNRRIVSRWVDHPLWRENSGAATKGTQLSFEIFAGRLSFADVAPTGFDINREFDQKPIKSTTTERPVVQKSKQKKSWIY